MRAARDSRTPPEVLVRLLKHPSALVTEEAAKTLAKHSEARDEHLEVLRDFTPLAQAPTQRTP